ncbi:peroxisome biogenesis factor 10-like [Drosophila rhopaloa]|uniref:Peroxisome biogenesis factor 10-like n=1 Tax=Drosophila rhopaloa TaxID=1041015 RepID=A0A6P4FJN5_DRORH|nr:peroxisome biogenesis factor 10-like [Drosophila rhopaloa]
MSENRKDDSQQGAGLIPLGSNQETAEVAAEPETPSEYSENGSDASVDVGCSMCEICGAHIAESLELGHLRNRSDHLLLPNEPSDHQQSTPSVEVNINISISVSPARGAPITIGTAGGQLTVSQTPISCSVFNGHSTNVCVQIQPSGFAADPEHSTSSNELVCSESLLRCPICLRSANNPRATSCGHVFCASCLHRALGIRSICPVCGVPQEYRNSLQIFP